MNVILKKGPYKGHTYKAIKHNYNQVIIVIDGEETVFGAGDVFIVDIDKIREEVKNKEPEFQEFFKNYVLKNDILFLRPQMKLF